VIRAAGKCGPENALVLFFACFLAGALASQRLFHTFLFAGLQIKGVTFHFLDDVLGLDFTLEAAERVFERLAFLQSDFCQLNYTPKLVLVELVSYCKIAAQSQVVYGICLSVLMRNA
jgi:hypothetical protein